MLCGTNLCANPTYTHKINKKSSVPRNVFPHHPDNLHGEMSLGKAHFPRCLYLRRRIDAEALSLSSTRTECSLSILVSPGIVSPSRALQSSHCRLETERKGRRQEGERTEGGKSWVRTEYVPPCPCHYSLNNAVGPLGKGTWIGLILQAI